ncbi:MAG TPA: cyclodeaminase/cyclohydrolase family protein [Ktedonobacteraceae bacterium]|nr:cyclodeaminase/cyclohydrolase family protein [Ktedonobacteraceae bacterium]
MYLDRPLHDYLDELASAQPTPGGGSAAALSGAMGAALASMVAHLTLGKAKYADVEPEVEELLQQTEKLRARFQQLMQEDIDAYGKLSASFKLPRNTPEEVDARDKAIQKQLLEAALVPLEMLESAFQLVQYCYRLAEIGNANVLSDIATGALLASSAGAGAAWMVRANLVAMKDLEMVNILSDRMSIALDGITEYSRRVTTIIGGRS